MPSAAISIYISICYQRCASEALAARRLVELRDRWLNPPEWVEWVDEPVPGYPKRPIPRDEDAAKALKKRTLTNLYNARPQGLADAHKVLGGLGRGPASPPTWGTCTRPAARPRPLRWWSPPSSAPPAMPALPRRSGRSPGARSRGFGERTPPTHRPAAVRPAASPPTSAPPSSPPASARAAPDAASSARRPPRAAA